MNDQTLYYTVPENARMPYEVVINNYAFILFNSEQVNTADCRAAEML